MVESEKPRILIVDDIPENLKILVEIFKGEGYQVTIASEGEQAVVAATLKVPDIILLDVQMPDMNGYEVCYRLKSIGETKDIPVIFLTARADTDDVIKGFEKGAVDYVTKPFRKAELLVRVKTHLELKLSREKLANYAKELALLNEQLYRYATTDEMTGVLNRKTGLAILESGLALSVNNKTPLSLCFVDINDLKYVNDTYGHLEGDELIKTVCTVMKQVVKETDTISRLGGDEFLLVMPDCGKDAAEEVWQRIQSRFVAYNNEAEKPYLLSASHGIVEYRWDSGLGVKDLLNAADEIMYCEKKTGK